MSLPDSAQEFIEKIDNFDLKNSGYNVLSALYKAVNEKRSELEAISKQLKKREEVIKSLLLNKMSLENVDSLKTKSGQLSIKLSESVVTQDKEAFVSWLREHPEHLDVLSARPYTQEGIKGLAGTDEWQDCLPDGLGLYREKKLSVRKV